MMIEFTNTFAAGEYAYADWTCSDAISRNTLYKVIKRTPKRVTLAAIYSNGLDRAVTYKIHNDNDREVIWDRDRAYARVLPAAGRN